jgi:hypothetical protein
MNIVRIFLYKLKNWLPVSLLILWLTITALLEKIKLKITQKNTWAQLNKRSINSFSLVKILNLKNTNNTKATTSNKQKVKI